MARTEACWIVQRGRVPLTVTDILTAIDNDPRIIVLPLDRTIIERSNALSTIGEMHDREMHDREMHDRQIAATALNLQEQGETVALLTKDANITTSGVVTIVW